MRLSTLFLPISLLAISTNAYWDDGHKIVATIAQIHLEPKVLATICEFLDLRGSKCHLAPLSTWADDHKKEMPWSANMHFVNPSNDHPPQRCLFPAPGVAGYDGTRHINVLDAIKNTTSILQRWVDRRANDRAAGEAVRFLTHFLGDLHQPMHVTGRERGGNGIKATFAGANSNLHQVWDNDILEKISSRTPKNYTKPLRIPQVENALQGAKYDPFIRRIMFLGVFDLWKGETEDWLACSSSATEKSMDFVPVDQNVMRAGVSIDPDTPVVCPYFWAKPIHQLNCKIAWTTDFDDKKVDELDTDEYFGEIEKQLILEKLLAQGGIRLAGLLNFVFSSEGAAKGLFVV